MYKHGKSSKDTKIYNIIKDTSQNSKKRIQPKWYFSHSVERFRVRRVNWIRLFILSSEKQNYIADILNNIRRNVHDIRAEKKDLYLCKTDRRLCIMTMGNGPNCVSVFLLLHCLMFNQIAESVLEKYKDIKPSWNSYSAATRFFYMFSAMS